MNMHATLKPLVIEDLLLNFRSTILIEAKQVEHVHGICERPLAAEVVVEWLPNIVDPFGLVEVLLFKLAESEHDQVQAHHHLFILQVLLDPVCQFHEAAYHALSPLVVRDLVALGVFLELQVADVASLILRFDFKHLI